MKKLIIISLILNILMALETPKYKVIEKDSNIEIRLYEKFTVAKTNVQSNYESATSKGFRIIANYIFGGNEKNMEIPMTAPVISTSPSIFPSSYDIMFFMPSEHSRESLPNPNLSTVKIEDVNFGKIASIKFGGWATNDNCIKYHKKLKEYLDGRSVNYSREFLVAQYNSPWAIPPFRKNEILVKINE